MTITIAPRPAQHLEDGMQLEWKSDRALIGEGNPGTLPGVQQGGGKQRSDEELVIAAQDGDSSALGELLARHQKMLYCFARRFTADADEAYDLVQETMLRAIRNIGKFRNEAHIATWLISIVTNAALSNKRREKYVRWVSLVEHEGDEARFCMKSLRDTRPNPEEDYSHRELSGLLRQKALKLHPKYRFIWKACDLDDRSIKEVAGALGMHPGAAKSRLQRARWSLSAAMKRSGAVSTVSTQDSRASDSICETIA